MSRAVLLVGIGTASLPNPVPPVRRTGSWAPVAYVPPFVPGPELVIDGSGVAIVNCKWTTFHLLLSAALVDLQFINVPAGGITVTVDIQQTATFAAAFGPNCTPLTGTPYAPSQTAGAVDQVTFTTTDGVTWRYQTAQPVSGGGGATFAVTIAPTPASATDVNDGVTPSAPSVVVTGTTANGTAPITHKWTRADSGGTNFLINNDTLAGPTLSIPNGTTSYNATQQWRDTATDHVGLIAVATVDVTLKRTTPVTATWNGVSGVAISHRTSGLASAYLWLQFNPDGTWQYWKQIAGSGAVVIASGTWGGGLVGADYEVQITPTHTSGAGSMTNEAATYTALGAARKITVSNHTSTPGASVSDAWSFSIDVRNIATHAIHATGTTTASLTSSIVT